MALSWRGELMDNFLTVMVTSGANRIGRETPIPIALRSTSRAVYLDSLVWPLVSSCPEGSATGFSWVKPTHRGL